MREPVFFDEKCRTAIAGKTPDEQLTILERMITDARFAKEQGYGPPADDINKARRLWLSIYDAHVAPHLNREKKPCVS